MECFNVVFVCSETGIRHYWPDVHQIMVDSMQGDYEMMGWHTMKPYKMEG